MTGAKSPPPTTNNTNDKLPTSLPFPPLYKSHINACAYPSWYPIFRPHTPKARIIPLPSSFITYLRSDGIVLPPSSPSTPRPVRDPGTEEDEGFFSSASHTNSSSDSEGDDGGAAEEEDSDPSSAWPETHAAIRAAVTELGGAVVPKLDWSAPKDAAWIGATNSLECRSANDVYLLLKSSDFVTHDLELWDHGCVDREEEDQGTGRAYHLVLRKWFRLNPSLEFRVFVRRGKVLGIGQRDLNHYEFLFGLRGKLRGLVVGFWEREVKGKFPEESYAMDVYVPPPYERVWIVDFNPWDRRTDPGTWSWLELLIMDDPPDRHHDQGLEGDLVRLTLRGNEQDVADDGNDDEGSEDESEGDVEDVQDTFGPEFRLVERDDPEAYMFNSTRYSAHKLPRDVVDASQSGAGGLREFADQWKDILARRQREEAQESDADDD